MAQLALGIAEAVRSCAKLCKAVRSCAKLCEAADCTVLGVVSPLGGSVCSAGPAGAGGRALVCASLAGRLQHGMEAEGRRYGSLRVKEELEAAARG